MITIYRTNYDFYGSTYVLCFSLSENIEKQIENWQAALDKIVFDEQMRLGSFRGRFPIDDTLRSLMERLQEKGIIQPYYGTTDARACIYTLQVTSPTCIIGVEHVVVGETASFEATVTVLQAEASEVAQNHKRGFMIKEKEYQSLQKWEFWNKDDEFTSRYIYTFSPSTVGLGIRVTDTQTKEQIDISDYSDW
ncbi:MAG: hypothetical protein KJ077_27065 [Anaerolineae bacterium]|nr:hypothetical protein [Anaerolineae bacterium]